MALSKANDNNPYNTKNAFKSYAEAVAAAKKQGFETNVYQTSGGTWHWQPQFQSASKPVTQASYDKTYGTTRPDAPGAMTESQALASGIDINELRKKGLLIETPQATDPNAFLNQLKAELQAQMDKFNQRVKEFDTNNPFTFDEMQARASSEERYNPYYDAELRDFLSGINAQRSTTQGERGLLTDLNRIQTSQDQTKVNEAIRQSEEGYAGAGLFFSGARQRDTGLTNVAGNLQTETRQKTFGQNMLANQNQLTNIATNESRGIRTTGAQRTTDIESDVARQKAEEEARYAQEKAQYVGYPYVKPTNGLNDLLLGAFT